MTAVLLYRCALCNAEVRRKPRPVGPNDERSAADWAIHDAVTFHTRMHLRHECARGRIGILTLIGAVEEKGEG